jgi:hypothetical protein
MKIVSPLTCSLMREGHPNSTGAQLLSGVRGARDAED